MSCLSAKKSRAPFLAVGFPINDILMLHFFKLNQQGKMSRICAGNRNPLCNAAAIASTFLTGLGSYAIWLSNSVVEELYEQRADHIILSFILFTIKTVVWNHHRNPYPMSIAGVSPSDGWWMMMDEYESLTTLIAVIWSCSGSPKFLVRLQVGSWFKDVANSGW